MKRFIIVIGLLAVIGFGFLFAGQLFLNSRLVRQDIDIGDMTVSGKMKLSLFGGPTLAIVDARVDSKQADTLAANINTFEIYLASVRSLFKRQIIIKAFKIKQADIKLNPAKFNFNFAEPAAKENAEWELGVNEVYFENIRVQIDGEQQPIFLAIKKLFYQTNENKNILTLSGQYNKADFSIKTTLNKKFTFDITYDGSSLHMSGQYQPEVLTKKLSIQTNNLPKLLSQIAYLVEKPYKAEQFNVTPMTLTWENNQLTIKTDNSEFTGEVSIVDDSIAADILVKSFDWYDFAPKGQPQLNKITKTFVHDYFKQVKVSPPKIVLKANITQATLPSMTLKNTEQENPKWFDSLLKLWLTDVE